MINPDSLDKEIDEYFDNVSKEQLIADFKEVGIELVDIDQDKGDDVMLVATLSKIVLDGELKHKSDTFEIDAETDISDELITKVSEKYSLNRNQVDVLHYKIHKD